MPMFPEPHMGGGIRWLFRSSFHASRIKRNKAAAAKSCGFVIRGENRAGGGSVAAAPATAQGGRGGRAGSGCVSPTRGYSHKSPSRHGVAPALLEL